MRSCPNFARTLLARILPLVVSGASLGAVASAQSAPPFRTPAQLNVPGLPGSYLTMPAARPRPGLAAAPNDSTPLVATPVFSVPQGAYSGPQTVTVTDATPGATLYYTLNGTSPTTNSPQYNGPIAISRSCTLVVMATLSGYQSSYSFAAYYITSVPDSFVYRIAGDPLGGTGDGGPATQARLSGAQGTAVDSSGNLYIADTAGNIVREVNASTGIISTVAGNGSAGYSGNGGPATEAQVSGPDSLAFDSSGNLYISQQFPGVVRKVTMSTGVITTYAGNPSANALGDGGPADIADIGVPAAIAIDGSDNLYILSLATCCFHDRVRKVDAGTQTITTVAGGGQGIETAGATATNISLESPGGIALDTAANIYIEDNNAVWEVTRSTGIISVYAGTPNVGGDLGDGGPATSATLNDPGNLAMDSKGNLYIAEAFKIRRVDASSGTISTVAGNTVGSNVECFAFVEDGSAALSSNVCSDRGLSVDSGGNLYFTTGLLVEELTAIGTPPSTPTADPTFSLSPGAYSSPQSLSLSDATPRASIYLYTVTNPPSTYDNSSTVVLPGLDLYLSSHPFNVSGPVTVFAEAVALGHIPSNVAYAAYSYSVPPTTVVSGFAGSGVGGLSGSGGPAGAAELTSPAGIATDSAGNFYIADQLNNVVWKVDTSGIITIVAGTGTAGHSGDNGPATAATLYYPASVVVDANGNLFIADTANNVVREVLASTGNIVPYAGVGLNGNPGGDGGPATSAVVGAPIGLALDQNSNLYISSQGVVREVNAKTGIIQTVAGNITASQLGDGGPATSAQLLDPQGLAVDAAGNLYIADEGNLLVREVNATTGIITTVAGNGQLGIGGDGELATATEVFPVGIALDQTGNLYITESPMADIRKVDAKSNMISTVTGILYTGHGYDPESASMAVVCPDLGILVDAQSNIYFSDNCQDTVRKITFNAPAPAPTFNPPAGTYATAQSVTIADTAPNSTIYYTTDGSTPTTSSAQYTSAISVSASETLNAIAVASGYGNSPAGSAAYVIGKANPAVKLSASANPAFVSSAVTFTAALSSSAGTPTGTVAFLDGSTQLGTATLASGSATYTTSSLAAGPHSITAQYSGDANFAAVTSPAVDETIVDFTIGTGSGGSTSATVNPGGTATYTLAVNPPAGTTTPAAVNFTIAGLPTGATGTFSPNPVPAGSGPTNVTLTVSVPSTSAAAPVPASRFPLSYGLLLLPLFGFSRRLRRQSRWFIALMVLAGSAAFVAFTGCGGGGGGNGGGGSTQPQPQTYTLTVTATAGTLAHTTTLTLTVQ